jgi:hypothetical protein
MGVAAFLAVIGFGVGLVGGVVVALLQGWSAGLLDTERHARRRALERRKQLDASGVQWRQPGDWVRKRR